MKTFVATFAAIAAMGLGSAAIADTAMSGDAMHGAMSASSPTMVCRAAMTGEMGNAKMGTESITCKPFDVAKAKATFEKMMMAKPGQPTQADIDAAWQKAFGRARG